MDNCFVRVKSIIQRLRDVLKCQKCLQFKKEDSMLFYHVCDHFYCIDCVGKNKSCPICENPFDKSINVLKDKNMLSLYQSLVNYELPTKEDVERICKNHKESKEQVLKNIKEVQETPRSSTRCKGMDMKVESVLKEGKKYNSSATPLGGNKCVGGVKESTSDLNITPKGRKVTRGTRVRGAHTASTSSRTNKMTTPVQKGRNISLTSNPTLRGKNTTPDTTPLGMQRNTTPLTTLGSAKSNTSSRKININKRNPKGETQLHLACKKSNLSMMSELIAAGANPNAQDNAGWTPLHESIFSGNIEVIKFLLDNGAKVNAPGLENTTALHEAIAKGNVQMVKLLLEYGADIKAMNIFRETPLDLVTKYKLEELKNILLEVGDNVKRSSNEAPAEENDDNIVIYKHNLTIEDEKSVNKFVEKFDVEVISSVTWKTPASHIVVQGNGFDITWTIISSVLNGCWIVSVDWIKDSLREDAPKPASRYELSNPLFSGFRKARVNKQNQLPGLFSGCHFFFGGNFESYTIKNLVVGKEDMKFLVEKNGGATLRRCPDPESLALEKTVPFHADPSTSLKETSYFIIYQTEKWDPKPKYNMSHMKTLPIDWLVSCIFKFELIDPNNKQFSCNDFL